MPVRPPPPRIRRLRARDAASTIRRHRVLFDDRPRSLPMRRYLADPRNLFLLATVEETAAGFLRGTALQQLRTGRPQFFLYEIGVAPPFRRRGIGRALLLELLRYCRAHGYDEVFVLTDPSNRAAVRLYRSTGAVTETPADRMFVYRLKSRGAASG